MKTLCLLLFLSFAALPVANAQTQANDLSIFLGKLQTYVASHNIQLKPNMPIAKHDGHIDPMPSPEVTGYMVDPVTKLRYYARYDKIVDMETRYSFYVATGKISLEPIKEKDTAYSRH